MAKYLLFFIMVLTACTTTKYVPVERVSTSTNIDNKVTERIDTVYQNDSIYIVQRGDTVREYHQRIIYKVKQQKDTVYKERTDTVTTTKVNTVTVEKELTSLQKLKQDIGGVVLVMVSALILAALIWLGVKYGGKIIKILGTKI